MGEISQENNGESKHQDRPDHPVLDKRDAENFPVFENIAQFFVADFCERGIHHQDQSERNGDIGRAYRDSGVEILHGCREEEAEGYADCHSEEYPEGKIAVEEG